MWLQTANYPIDITLSFTYRNIDYIVCMLAACCPLPIGSAQIVLPDSEEKYLRGCRYAISNPLLTLPELHQLDKESKSTIRGPLYDTLQAGF